MLKFIDLPADWKEAKRVILQKRGKVFVVGKVDSGKTTFSFYLAKEAIQQGIKVAIVDSDIGQSTIGPPTTIGLKFFNCFSSLNNLKADFLYFVGDTSPRFRALEVLAGTKKMVDKASERLADLTIIDSCGLFAPPFGLNLKLQKINLIQPSFIIAFAKGEEVKDFEQATKGYSYNLIKLSSSPMARTVSPEERRANREKSFEDYFKKGKEVFLDLKNFSLYPNILNYDFLFPDFQNLLVGLFNQKDECLGIGIALEAFRQENKLKVFTPLKKIEKVSGLKFGTLKLSTRGKELGRLTLYGWPDKYPKQST